jgi:hypothetical protein
MDHSLSFARREEQGMRYEEGFASREEEEMGLGEWRMRCEALFEGLERRGMRLEGALTRLEG